MRITKPAVAGTMESSDVMIQLSPGDGSVEIELSSTVDMYYRDDILKVIGDTLKEVGIDSVRVNAMDHGALDCTIRARVTTAVKRALKEETV